MNSQLFNLGMGIPQPDGIGPELRRIRGVCSESKFVVDQLGFVSAVQDDVVDVSELIEDVVTLLPKLLRVYEGFP